MATSYASKLRTLKETSPRGRIPLLRRLTAICLLIFLGAAIVAIVMIFAGIGAPGRAL